MARARSKPTKAMYVLPTDHSASPNEQMISIANPPEDGRTTMLATPGVPFDAASLHLSEEDLVEMIAKNDLPFLRVEVEDYEQMNVTELRDVAKDKGIEGTSKMDKGDLISALSKPLDQAEIEDELEEENMEELRDKAKAMGLEPSGLKKAELVEMIAEQEAATDG